MSTEQVLIKDSEKSEVKPMTEGKMELVVQYHKLTSLIKDIEREVKPMYAGNKNSAETIKKGISSLFGLLLTKDNLEHLYK